MTGIRRCRVGPEKPTLEPVPTAGPLKIDYAAQYLAQYDAAMVALGDILSVLAVFPPTTRRWIHQAVSSCLAMEE